MLVLDDEMGQNGLRYGCTAKCRRYSYVFEAKNRMHAILICKDMGLIFDGEIIASYEAGGEDEADWWKNV